MMVATAWRECSTREQEKSPLKYKWKNNGLAVKGCRRPSCSSEEARKAPQGRWRRTVKLS